MLFQVLSCRESPLHPDIELTMAHEALSQLSRLLPHLFSIVCQFFSPIIKVSIPVLPGDVNILMQSGAHWIILIQLVPFVKLLHHGERFTELY